MTIKKFKVFENDHYDIDPYGEEIWDGQNKKETYEYDEFENLAPANLFNRFIHDYYTCSDDDDSVENYYNANYKYWSRKLNEEI